jgi:hypothetical protein
LFDIAVEFYFSLWNETVRTVGPKKEKVIEWGTPPTAAGVIRTG